MKLRLQEKQLQRYGAASDGTRYFDYSGFPQEFDSMETALDTYNRMGLPHRIMFKTADMGRNEAGLIYKFKLICFHHMAKQKHISNTSVNLRNDKGYKCPVCVSFRWRPDPVNPGQPESKEGKFIRMPSFIMQHTHALVIDERRVLQRVEI